MGEFFDLLFKRSKRSERFAIWGTLGFLVVIGVMVVYADDVLWTMGIDIAGQHRNRVIDCKKPQNKNSPYCQDFKARQESNWRGITRFGDQPTAFTLHGR